MSITYNNPLGTNPQEQGASLRILVADDNEFIQTLMCTFLQHLGYMADVAYNGHEVLNFLRKSSYDLIFLDLNMPIMNGIETTKAIRQEYPMLNIYIIGLTAHSAYEQKYEFQAAGLNQFKRKPLLLADINNAIKDCERERRG
ncbi:MAG TPA: response regulator [Anaerolineae bacterium]|nr:response regulator [Anaerolineae bacterium]